MPSDAAGVVRSIDSVSYSHLVVFVDLRGIHVDVLIEYFKFFLDLFELVVLFKAVSDE